MEEFCHVMEKLYISCGLFTVKSQLRILILQEFALYAYI